MDREAIETELLEIELMLANDALKYEDRSALFGAQQALRNVLDPEKWQSGSQTFYRVGALPTEAASKLRH